MINVKRNSKLKKKLMKGIGVEFIIAIQRNGKALQN